MNLDTEKWKSVKLGNICNIEYGNNLTAKMRNDGKVPVYGSAGIVGWHDSVLTNSETLVIGRKGSVGNVFYSSIPCFPIDTTFYVQQNDCKEDLRWIALFLNYYDLSNLNMATAVPGLNRNIAHLIEIPLPPLEEQKRIAALFQSIDAAIEQTEAQEKNLRNLITKLSEKLVNRNPEFGNLINADYLTFQKLGSISYEKRETSKNPNTDGFERFVGLEHIEPGNLKIRNWGNVADGTTFTKTFQPGDVLFGRRRAYLKKVAVADFKGLCSGDITVIVPDKDKILLELFLYYISADAVFDHAVSTSAGSLSPRTKWKDLSKFEISLPPLDVQEKILDVFQSIQNSIDLIHKQYIDLKNLKQNLLDEILGD